MSRHTPPPVRSKRKSCSTSHRCNGALCVRCCPDGYREADVGGADSVLASSRRSSGRGYPGATELEYPHRPAHGRCCARHKVWRGLDEELAELRALAEEGEHDERWILAQLRKHPRYAEWMAQTHQCEEQLAARIARRQPKGGADSAARQRGRARARYIREGGDVTGREYRDTLKSAEAKRAPRARYKASPATSRGPSRR